MSTLLNKPSTLVHQVKVNKGTNWIAFKLNRALQTRQQELIGKSETGSLTADEAAELEAIQELDSIFSYVNNEIARQQRNYLR